MMLMLLLLLLPIAAHYYSLFLLPPQLFVVVNTAHTSHVLLDTISDPLIDPSLINMLPLGVMRDQDNDFINHSTSSCSSQREQILAEIFDVHGVFQTCIHPQASRPYTDLHSSMTKYF
ncbi:hypothetical protein PsorP6_016061 [Peronosclerospora sorghi]|uniref:Uncharacterized protein n=1 Tax=Peronosclerospora sorghi TaxID=230839 RepID=A0ACC0WQJ9_9STRA|nr:hypothetical protein PsorP6_016061 [Peronosclerospora sorghi]